jgi:hypothetical protein
MPGIAPPPTRRRVVALAGAAGIGMAGFSPSSVAWAAVTAQPTPESFASMVNSDFGVWEGDGYTRLRLVEVRRYKRGHRPHGLPQPFSLFFFGPPGRQLASDTYEVEAPDGGRSRMFVTPVGGRSLYEAPFN